MRIPIAERETEEYAMSLPDILRIKISSGERLVDRRPEFYPIYYKHYLKQQEVKQNGQGKGQSSEPRPSI